MIFKKRFPFCRHWELLPEPSSWLSSTCMIGTYIPTCIWSFLHEDNLHLCEILVVSGHGLWTIVIVLKAFQFDSCNQWELCTFLYFFFQTHHSLHESGIASDLSYLQWESCRSSATYDLWLKANSWSLNFKI